MACQGQDNEAVAAAELIAERGLDGLGDAVSMLINEAMRLERERHRTGICNYAEHPITTARLEGGHVAIGLIRKRARGLLDTDYFKLKIRQSAVPEPPLGLYALTG